MAKHKHNHGFTILEVTIAITLTTAGMILGMMMINNRLRQENFQKGAARFVSIIDDTLNDVATNNWPHVDGWACDLNSKPPTGQTQDGSLDAKDLNFWQDANHQTGDGNCLYVGRVIQFGDEGNYDEEDNTYIVHTIMTHREALIPTYNFDLIASLANNGTNRLHPLGVVEKPSTTPGTPGFSTRETRSWPNGMHVSQVYYDDGEDFDPDTDPTDKVFLRGIAVVQQAGHGLTENDLLLTISGEGQIGLRVVHDRDRTTTGAKNPTSARIGSNAFAESLKRTPGTNNPNPNDKSEIERDFKLPIYMCASDGRGNRVLLTLGGKFGGSLLAESEFDEARIDGHCG